MQRLQFFLSEAACAAKRLIPNDWRCWAPSRPLAPPCAGVLVFDDIRDRKEAGATDHVTRQCLGSVGKIDHSIVALTTLWADEVRHHPLHAAPYTSAVRLADGKRDAAFATEAANCAGPGRAGAGRGRPVQRHRGGLLLWRQLST